MRAEQVAQLEQVREQLKPSDVNLVHERLFSNDDFNLYKGTDNWDQEREDLQRRRNEAVAEILARRGLEGVLSLVETAEAPRKVGDALGPVADASIDVKLLPAQLRSKSRNVAQFLEGFIWVRRAQQGWEWVDSQDMSTWSSEEVGRFFSSLPFTHETWERVEDRLGTRRAEYWTNVFANPYHASKQGAHLQIAVERLLEHGRPRAAVECLYKMAHDHEAFSPELAVIALMEAVASKEPAPGMQHHYIVDVIRHLQKDDKTDPNDLRDVEWAYLALLGSREETRPIELERRISTDAAFYIQLIRAIYRSERERDKPKREPSESERAIAGNAWRLLHEWKRVPGEDGQGNLEPKAFKDWVEDMKQLANESGHLSVAMIQFGEVLIHAPADPKGLWIDRAVAAALNGKDAEKMRQGFSTGIFNSRGAHWVDPSGEPEKELAEEFRSKGEAVESAGFHRLAVTMRQLAESYEREAQRVIAERDGE
jgi:hypothetical protein